MTRSFRIWGKKRGDRRTGSNLLGTVGEALFFAALFLIGTFALIALLTSYLVQPVEAEAYSSGWGLWLVLLILTSLILIGAGGMIHNIMHVGTSAERRSAFAKRASDIDILADTLPSARDYPSIPRNENLTNSPGINLAYRLPIVRSPAWKLLAAALFCLVWNGFVSVITVLVVRSHLASQSNWFLTLFLLPFVIVGVRSVYHFLRLLLITTGIGPTSVEVSNQPFFPGHQYDIFVTQAGRLNVKSFRVLLVCDEEAIYRQGTDVRTERRTVHEQQIFRKENFEIAPGLPFEHRCDLVVPPGVMHSLKSSHNAIEWKIVVQGEAARWPPFERGFPIVVYPSHVDGTKVG